MERLSNAVITKSECFNSKYSAAYVRDKRSKYLNF